MSPTARSPRSVPRADEAERRVGQLAVELATENDDLGGFTDDAFHAQTPLTGVGVRRAVPGVAKTASFQAARASSG